MCGIAEALGRQAQGLLRTLPLTYLLWLPMSGVLSPLRGYWYFTGDKVSLMVKMLMLH